MRYMIRVCLLAVFVAFARDVAAARQVIPTVQNFMLHSQQFVNATWGIDHSGSGSDPVVTDNFALAPDGTMTAARIQFNDGGAGFSRIVQNASVVLDPNRTDYIASIYLKTNDGSTKTLDLRIGANDNIVTLTGVWQRFAVDAHTSVVVQLLAWSAQGTSNTVDALAWQAQFVAANWAGPPCLTTTAVVNTGNIRNLR